MLLYSNIFTQCRNNGNVETITTIIEKKVPIIITERDTIYIEVDIEPTLSEKYIQALKKYIGTREKTGKNDGPVVEKILLNCGINFPAAWCACFLNQGLLDIELTGPIDPAWSPNWFKDKSRIKYIRDINPKSTKFEQGWIVGIYFRNLGRIAHVAAVIEDFGDNYILTIEGNTNAQGGREGDGVYLRIRHKSEIYMASDWLY